MEPGEYEALVARAGAGSSTAAIDLLQAMRTHKIRQPELVVLHGGRLLKSSQMKLGAELWTVMEQVFLAAVELGTDNWRDYCLKQLVKKFPSSVRVDRLRGIAEERRGMEAEPGEAEKIYKKVLEDKPEDTMTRKRLIAMYKQRGKTVEAVKLIHQYLDMFSTDTEAWHELAELYIEAGSLQRAAFCFEELMLANPRSMYHVLTYAELLYSIGDYDLSRKYFSLAAYLDGSCLRALWGLVAVNLQLAEKDKANEKIAQLHKFTLERLKTAYAKVGTHGKLVLGLLLKDGLS